MHSFEGSTEIATIAKAVGPAQKRAAADARSRAIFSSSVRLTGGDPTPSRKLSLSADQGGIAECLVISPVFSFFSPQDIARMYVEMI